MFVAFLSSVLLLLAQNAPPSQQVDTEARAKVVAPFLDDLTFAIVRIDVSKLNVDATSDLLMKIGSAANFQAEAIKPTLSRHVSDFLRAGGKEEYVIISAHEFGSSDPIVVVPVPAGVDAKALADAVPRFSGIGPDSIEQFGPVLVGGRQATLERLKKLKPTPRPEVAQAFAAAGDMTAQILFVPTAQMRHIVEEMLPTIPMVRAIPMTTLTHGVHWAAIGLEAGPQWAVRAVIQAQDAESAQTFNETIGKLAILGRAALAMHGSPQLQKLDLSNLFRLQTAGSQLRWSLDDQQIRSMATAVAPSVEQLDSRQRSMHTFKQLGVAMHNYYDSHNGFPTAASYDTNGKPLLSWRVHLLPYLDQEALYKEFHLDEPWDSDHNKKLIAKMPAIFRSPTSGKNDEVRTVFVAPLGDATMFPGKQAVQFKDILDGTANTIFLVQAADDQAVVWSKPEDLTIDPKDPAKGLTRAYRDGFPVLFVDGSTRMLPATIDAKMLWAFFTRNGGEVVKAP